MTPTLMIVIVVCVFAFCFDFLNGFHDAANSIATVVSTRVLTPAQAVCWAAFFNFIAAFSFGTGVAKTVGHGMVKDQFVTPSVLLAALFGAILWDLATWWLGLPTSSSHAIVGGLAGSAIAKAQILQGFSHSFAPIQVSGWIGTIAFILLAPLIGLILAGIGMQIVYRFFGKQTPKQSDKLFRRLQLLSAAALSWAHGTNDAQKTMGVITGLLVSVKYLPSFKVPIWVVLFAHTAMGLGTLAGGWRIIHTIGKRLTKLKPRTGFCAEAGAAASILFSTFLKLPVSTTHVTAGAIAGVGTVQRVKAVRWGVAANIVWAWVLTIPAAALLSWMFEHAFHWFPGSK
ncbi:MAG: inorganic phosphate transporter [Acidobacteriaceae bacterium]|nr:inorganic phosphate transporter [Acidobacteriaceae bacterium]